MTDFDKPADHTKTPVERWDRHTLRAKFGHDDVLPFWIADMEFEAPESVRDCLVRRAEQGAFGYECRPDSLGDTIVNWHARRHSWTFQHHELCFSHGTMQTIAMLLNLYTDAGDGIIIQPPVYFEFQHVINVNHRQVITSPLVRTDSGYEMDFNHLERSAARPDARMLLLCSPHNPVGRVWTRYELEQLAEICLRHDVLIVADEVHGDFVFSGHTFVPIASLSPEIAKKSVSCLSPAKTFSLPAVTNSYAVITDDVLRDHFHQCVERFCVGKFNTFSVAAAIAAYSSAEEWLTQAIGYVEANVQFLRESLVAKIPGVQLLQSEGTFLGWLDFRETRPNADELDVFLARQARLGLKSGQSFGPQGAGYARMSLACPRQMLEEAVRRLENASRASGKSASAG